MFQSPRAHLRLIEVAIACKTFFESDGYFYRNCSERFNQRAHEIGVLFTPAAHRQQLSRRIAGDVTGGGVSGMKQPELAGRWRIFQRSAALLTEYGRNQPDQRATAPARRGAGRKSSHRLLSGRGLLLDNGDSWRDLVRLVACMSTKKTRAEGSCCWLAASRKSVPFWSA